MKKKIGICTLEEACNIGALLQSFALQETLKKFGYEPEFLKLENCVFYNLEERTQEFIDMRKHLNISNNYYNSQKDTYDAIIVGSDEIWNLESNSYSHIDEFFGYNLSAPKIIAYAPGANTTNGETFNKYYNGKLNLNNFTHLSVRDTNALDIVNKVANKNAPIVLDPTFLLDSYEPYIKECPEHDFILVYGWLFKDEEKKAIMNFAKKRNLKLCFAGFEHQGEWCDEFIGADIFKFVSYVKHAKYVITSNSFHGIVFSLIFNKQFITMTHGNFKSKEMITRAGLSDRDCNSVDEILEKLEQKIDYTNVNKWIQSERQKSIDYLKNSIES